MKQNIFNLSKLKQIDDMLKRPRINRTILDAMVLTRDFLVSDPHDKIVAVLGMVNEKPRDELQSFRADSMVPVDTYYHRFAIHPVKIVWRTKF